jgi:hypothetical protein
MGDLLGSLIWGAKSGQYCVIGGGSLHFILGRLITDNILVAFDTLHTMDTRLKWNKGYMTLKLDMSKAYDQIEWSFLEAVLGRMGFANRWIQLLMTCVRTVTYSILINGQPQGHIVPTRGLRQGDPLSPYFFIICAEALSSLLQYGGRHGSITGVPISRRGTRINHLFLRMTTFCFVGQILWSGVVFRNCYLSMRKLRVRSSIETKRLYFLARILRWWTVLILSQRLGFLTLNGMKIIWGSQSL